MDALERIGLASLGGPIRRTAYEDFPKCVFLPM
jgi:hypothetical protein